MCVAQRRASVPDRLPCPWPLLATICIRPLGISTRVSSLARQFSLSLTHIPVLFLSNLIVSLPLYPTIHSSLSTFKHIQTYTYSTDSLKSCELRFCPSLPRSVTGMVQSDLVSDPLSKYKEEPADDPVSIELSFSVISFSRST